MQAQRNNHDLYDLNDAEACACELGCQLWERLNTYVRAGLPRDQFEAEVTFHRQRCQPALNVLGVDRDKVRWNVDVYKTDKGEACASALDALRRRGRSELARREHSE